MGQGSERAALVPCGLSLTRTPGEPRVPPLGRPGVGQVLGADKGCPAPWPVPSSQPPAGRAAMAQGPPPCARSPPVPEGCPPCAWSLTCWLWLLFLGCPGLPLLLCRLLHDGAHPLSLAAPVHVCRPSSATCVWGWLPLPVPGLCQEAPHAACSGYRLQ